MRGAVLIELQRFAEALICTDRVTQINPELAVSWSYRGVALAKLQQYDLAIASCQKAIQLEPNNGVVWYYKAKCEVLQGNPEAAINDLKAAFEINSNIRQELTEDPDFNVLQDNAIYQQLIAS
jgi:tetratricopeptide (TPR) repeat protein